MFCCQFFCLQLHKKTHKKKIFDRIFDELVTNFVRKKKFKLIRSDANLMVQFDNKYTPIQFD